MMAKVLAIIPARSGSKGIPKKNLRLVGDVPLIVHTIEASKKAKLIDRRIVSTDDAEAAQIARQHGVDVPFIRPAELASDTATSVDVVIHALQACQKEDQLTYDIVALLQPTTPFRTAGDIDATIALLLDASDIDAAITVAPAGRCNLHYFYRKNDADGRWTPVDKGNSMGVRRQDQEQLFIRTGAVYAVRSSYLLIERKLMSEQCLAHIMTEENAINIDSEFDLFLANQLIKHRASRAVADLG